MKDETWKELMAFGFIIICFLGGIALCQQAGCWSHRQEQTDPPAAEATRGSAEGKEDKS